MRDEHQVHGAFPNILSKSKYHTLRTPTEGCEFHIRSISVTKEKVFFLHFRVMWNQLQTQKNIML